MADCTPSREHPADPHREAMLPAPSSPMLAEEWQGPLEKLGFDSARIRKLVADAYCGAETQSVYPQSVDQVFRAFERRGPEGIAVVILGQDPYFAHAEQADGLAFSVPMLDESVAPEVRFPPSLQTVFANLEIDDEVVLAGPNLGGVPVGDLSGWAEQGVLLLNTALTVSHGAPASHLERWRGFTDAVVRVLNSQSTPIAFMLWGEKAQARARLVDSPHKVFEMPHPGQPAQKSASSAWRSGLTRPFKDVNSFLRDNGREPIEWGRTMLA